MASIQPHCATRELHVNSCRKRIQVSMKQMQLVCITLFYLNRTRIGVGFTWIYVSEIYVKPKRTNLIEGHPDQTDLKFNQNISLWEENWRLKIIAITLLYLDAFISLYIFNCILEHPIKYPRKYPKYHVRQWTDINYQLVRNFNLQMDQAYNCPSMMGICVKIHHFI